MTHPTGDTGLPSREPAGGRRDQRPSLHVTAARGWINDPNGPIQWGDRHHLFFQHNPIRPVWAPAVHWGHAVSDDLVRWRHVEHALVPSPGTADAGGCWSGCVVDDGGVPTAVYSGLAAGRRDDPEGVCLARSDDELLRWHKDERNPVLAGPPPDLGVTAFRDPFVWHDGSRWVMIMGAGRRGAGAVLAYESPDLVEWTYRGVVLAGADVETPVPLGTVWECPQLVAVGDRHALIVSAWDGDPLHSVAFVGSYTDFVFSVEHVDRFDHGADCYAPATMRDARGRHLAWAWAWEGRPEAAAVEQGWAGALTFPRVLTLTSGGRLGIAPAPELGALRAGRESLDEVTLGPGRAALVPETRGDRLELSATVAAGAATELTLEICASPGREEVTTIAWRPGTRRLTFDRSRSSHDPAAAGGVHGGTVPGSGGDLELRVFIDRSMVEVYADGCFTLTERIHPTRHDATGIALSAAGGEAVVRGLEIWVLEPPPR